MRDGRQTTRKATRLKSFWVMWLIVAALAASWLAGLREVPFQVAACLAGLAYLLGTFVGELVNGS